MYLDCCTKPPMKGRTVDREYFYMVVDISYELLSSAEYGTVNFFEHECGGTFYGCLLKRSAEEKPVYMLPVWQPVDEDCLTQKQFDAKLRAKVEEQDIPPQLAADGTTSLAEWRWREKMIKKIEELLAQHAANK